MFNYKDLRFNIAIRKNKKERLAYLFYMKELIESNSNKMGIAEYENKTKLLNTYIGLTMKNETLIVDRLKKYNKTNSLKEFIEKDEDRKDKND
tara:strand:+ start:1218 stop:1496 length:279 start_codon:yes stop_codon:yes gene_type:complete